MSLTTSETSDVDDIKEDLKVIVKKLKNSSYDTQEHVEKIEEVIEDLEYTTENEPEEIYGGAITRAMQRISGIKSSMSNEIQNELSEVEIEAMCWENV